ncbi:QDR1 [Candida oxycetoniae]|uniref:QDR1 n=1 Tax=Candida oxycetoniae TaxID=497107 RepID=A0AAI9WZA2_9ASCO|nr:QDR1 [Candida oxycetoniae]KAI3405978.2 QDR1 [Candida oxycetoniae]
MGKYIEEDDNQETLHSFATTESKENYPYTIFEKREKFLLILILSAIGFWSTISSPIYFPALPTLTSDFHTSVSMMNITVVSYLLFQGLAPTVSSNIADTIGRRPVLLASLLIYIASCIALSQTDVYWLLILLRCIQAAGIAPVISISSGVSADVCTTVNRGAMVGAVTGFQFVGNGIGGLVGAALISGFDTWRSMFIFLAIGGMVTLLAAIFVLPETSRNIVGNGTVVPKNILNKSALICMPFFKKKLTNEVSTITPKNPFDILGPFRIFIEKEIFFTLLPSGMHFAAWTIAQASLSTELESPKYNYSVMHVGLIYLPQGLACLFGSLIVGKMMNWYYTYRRKLYDTQMENVPIHERPPFNIIATRLTLTIVPTVLMVIGLVTFGWCIQFHRHIISIIISSSLISFSSTLLISISTTMLVDLHPTQGSASSSCLNLMRCWLAALFAGVLDKMVSSMNLGGTYTLMAGLCLLSDCGLVLVLYWAKQTQETFSSTASTRVQSAASSFIEK